MIKSNFKFKWSVKIAVKEVVIEDIEVSKGLLDYINSHRVTNIVLGASSRSALSRFVWSITFSLACTPFDLWINTLRMMFLFLFCRKFWSHDVPTIINKSAPDFCTVYVISKGKQQSVRPAAKPFASSLSSTLPSSQPWSAARLSNYSESSDVSRYQITENVFWSTFFLVLLSLGKTRALTAYCP